MFPTTPCLYAFMKKLHKTRSACGSTALALQRAVAFIALLFLSACNDKTAAQLIRNSGPIAAKLEVIPAAPSAMQTVALRLKLSGPGNEPVAGRQVRFDATMPGMAMPETHFPALEVAPGIYRAQALFTMAGKWRLRAVTELFGVGYSFAFDLTAK